MQIRAALAGSLAILVTSLSPALASDEIEELIITAGSLGVTQGGAQDIDSFRGAVVADRIPHPNTFTAEGLLSQHDILLDVGGACDQILCLSSEVIEADLIAKPNDELLVGLGFGTNLQADQWKRGPLNLVAVVDKSGSMGGAPIELVKRSLINVVGKLHKGDRLSIVLYGSTAHVHLVPLKITRASKSQALKSIDAIVSQGSTAMENGLRIGYDLALETGKSFHGSTRVMLFTDERPNVGRTDADSFMEMAREASGKGIGLTTIGVSTHFGAELATTISSVRGGNLYFLNGPEDADRVFSEEFDYMVSELAHDLQLVIEPDPALRISGIYGVPGQLTGWQDDGAVSITIPTVFLAARAGGIFFTLARSKEYLDLPAPDQSTVSNLAKVNLSYRPIGGLESSTDTEDVGGHLTELSDGIKLGRLLIDEFTVLRKATTDHYANDQESAYQSVHALANKFRQTAIAGLEDEMKLVFRLERILGGLSGHHAEDYPPQNTDRLMGVWEVYRKRGTVNLNRRDKIEFAADGILKIYHHERRLDVFEDDEDFLTNEDQIYLEKSKLTFEYRFNKNNLILHHERDNVTIHLKPSKLRK